MCYRTWKYTLCRRVRASFSPDILQAGAVNGLRGQHSKGLAKTSRQPFLLLPWARGDSRTTHALGNAWVKENDQTDRLAGKTTLTSGLLLGKSEVLRSGAWDSTCGHKAKDITQSIAWRREAWTEEALVNLPWMGESEPSSIRRTLKPMQRRRSGNFWDRVERYGFFPAHSYHLELNWTERFTSARLTQSNSKIHSYSCKYGQTVYWAHDH